MENPEIIKIVVFAALGLIGFIFILNCLIVTRQKEAKIIQRFGKYVGFRRAGLGLKIGFIDTIAGTVDLRINELREEIGVKSKDNAFLTVPVKVQFKVLESAIEKAFYELDNAESQIMSYVVNVVRSKANDMDMDDIFRSKDAFESEVKLTLNETFDQYGYVIVNVLVDDPQPSHELKAAFDRVLAAKRDQEASLLEKQAIRNRVVGQAEAEAESIRLKASAYVDMREIMAKGNSKAIGEFCEGLDVSHSEALQYFAGLDSRDAIRDAAKGPGSIIVVPLDGLDNNFSSNIAMTKAIAGKKS